MLAAGCGQIDYELVWGASDGGGTTDGASGTDGDVPDAGGPDAEPVRLVVSVEDAPGGTGAPIGALAMRVGESRLVYAVGRTAAGAFVEDVVVAWSSSGAALTLAPASGSSARLTAAAAGMATGTASHDLHGRDDFGPVTVTACTSAADCSDPCFTTGLTCTSGACVTTGAADKDADGDGFVDAACPGGDDCDDEPASCGSACAPGLAEVCDGRDNDCSASTADGADDSAVGLMCDGPDTDSCAEGTKACTGGSLHCGDATSDSVEGPSGSATCSDGVDNDCNGTTDAADAQCMPSTGDGVLLAIADTYLSGVEPSPVGGEVEMRTGRDNSGARMYALIRFDVSMIAAGFASARLRLYQVSSGRTGTLTTHVHRVTRAWDEATASWTDASAGTPWSVAGGDADLAEIATTPVPLGASGWYEWDVTPLVRDWIAGTHPNHGMLLDWEWPSNGVWVGFATRENATAANRPQLVITP